MRRRSRENVMKKLCAFLAVALSFAFAGATLAQDKKDAPKEAPKDAPKEPEKK